MCIACNHTIHRKHHNFFWSRDFAPALVCKPGKTIRFECIDAGSGHFTRSSTEGGAGRQGSSFQVLADDTLGLVSESGSGKTTIGRRRSDSSSFERGGRRQFALNGLRASAMKSMFRDVQMVFRDPDVSRCC